MRTWMRPSVVLLSPWSGGRADAPADIDAALEDFERWCQAHAGAVCDVALSGRWLLSCVVPDEANEQAEEMPLSQGGRGPARDPLEAMRAYAERQWDHYLGLDAGDLARQWVVRPLMQGQVRLVCAMPSDLLEGLTRHAKAHAVVLRRVRPWWICALQAWMAAEPGQTALAMAERTAGGQFITWARWSGRPSQGGVLESIWSEWRGPAVSGDADVQDAQDPHDAAWRVLDMREHADVSTDGMPHPALQSAAWTRLLLGQADVLQEGHA
ncbi:MAG: hypothetical protein QM742_15630 [Aquabacterium sp.]